MKLDIYFSLWFETNIDCFILSFCYSFTKKILSKHCQCWLCVTTAFYSWLNKLIYSLPSTNVAWLQREINSFFPRALVHVKYNHPQLKSELFFVVLFLFTFHCVCWQFLHYRVHLFSTYVECRESWIHVCLKGVRVKRL